MKITKPSAEVEVCDLCHREDCYLQTCAACGKEFCLTCEGTMGGSYGFVYVCRDCSRREDVKKICQRYSDRLSPIFQERQQKLRRLRKKKEKP
jgi:hypothetical protein